MSGAPGPSGPGSGVQGETDHGTTGSLNAEDLAYRARALAQAHPLTSLARQYVDRSVAEQRTSQPIPEIGIWAGAATIGGYCLRRVEEAEVGQDLHPS